eukprot:s30_g42.t1
MSQLTSCQLHRARSVWRHCWCARDQRCEGKLKCPAYFVTHPTQFFDRWVSFPITENFPRENSARLPPIDPGRCMDCWACPACTFENLPTAECCEICEKGRPGGWICSKCTLQNEDGVDLCEACGKPRAAASATAPAAGHRAAPGPLSTASKGAKAKNQKRSEAWV